MRAAATQIVCVGLLLLVCALGCRSERGPSTVVPLVDLLTEFPTADARPSGAFHVGFHRAAGTTLAAIVGPAPGRITWTLPIPREASFRARLAARSSAVRVRVGVSDLRVYEPLATRVVTPDAGWIDIDAPLSEYAGMKISLFYHPERYAWRINVSADPMPQPATIALALPQIVVPERDVPEYAHRVAHLGAHAPVSR